MRRRTVLKGLVAAIAVATLLPSCLPLPAAMVRVPGTVHLVDKRTGDPVEGAVVLRSWQKCNAAFPAGGSCSDFTFREAASDATGVARFPPMVKPYVNFVLIPIVWWNWVQEAPALVVYKPGYTTLIETPGASTYALEKVPDSYWRRSEEAYRAAGYGYVHDVRATRLLRDALDKEAQDVERLAKDVPGLLYHDGIRPPPQGGSLRVKDVATDNQGLHYLAADGPPSVSVLEPSGAWTRIQVEFPWGASMHALATDEGGGVFALVGDKVVRFSPFQKDSTGASARRPHVTLGTMPADAERFVLHDGDVFLVEADRSSTANVRPPRARPVLYRYDIHGSLVCQSEPEPELAFRDLAVAPDGGSVLVVGNGERLGNQVIRYDPACRQQSSCRLPRMNSDRAASIAALPFGKFAVTTADGFGIYDDQCTPMLEETFLGREFGKVAITRTRSDALAERLFFVDEHYGRLLVYDVSRKLFPDIRASRSQRE